MRTRTLSNWRLNWRSLRWRIALLVCVTCCGVALSIGLLVHRSTQTRSMNDGAAKALTALSYATERYAQDSGPTPDALVTDTAAMPDRLLRLLEADPPGATWYDDDPVHPSMWAARTIRGEPVALSSDMTSDLLTRRALDRHMWQYSALALAVFVPLSALAAELPNRRLRRVARTARRITDGDLAARTSAGPRDGDEIGAISAAVDSMADSLHARLQAEQRFTADVAHELRTPLMGLIVCGGLLPESEATDMVRDRLEVLRNLIEELLEISRLDAGAETADPRPVPLAAVVLDLLRRTGLDTRFTSHDEPTVDTDPRRLDRVITNLVTNAHRHGRTPVEVEVRGTVVTVRDHGPGFPEDLLRHGPQRFRTGAAERGHGHGLGLTIALGHARVIGAALDFRNAPDGGAVAELRLPDVS
ncbi:HAMP domain-containing histidine kinase [Streptomyces kunmingensis]|uniref:histidine kinase n=1 Tax=Streptomyces kunmingensis TaxID=68225 RepID=A0ABU6C2I5_9ACTN|nr:HAMP domain-containing sensor histidine kinase [Streptomyces kunmingensis]MEB3958915.1 HAMP domain-containing histidine kinase [Streptomyces kunmingensis]